MVVCSFSKIIRFPYIAGLVANGASLEIQYKLAVTSQMGLYFSLKTCICSERFAWLQVPQATNMTVAPRAQKYPTFSGVVVGKVGRVEFDCCYLPEDVWWLSVGCDDLLLGEKLPCGVVRTSFQQYIGLPCHTSHGVVG